MKNKIYLLIIIVLISSSCGVLFKTYHKDKLIDFTSNSLTDDSLKINGYYFIELEREYGDDLPPFIDEYVKTTGITKIKYLSAFFFYEDGYVVNLNGIDGLSRFYCAEKVSYENTYESAHKTIELMLEAQHSDDKKTKRICGFDPKDIVNKGLVKINNDSIKIQTYKIEYSTPTVSNAAYLYELNGTIQSDSSFVIKSKTRYLTHKETTENSIFRFRQTDQKPNVENYFKKNINRFK